MPPEFTGTQLSVPHPSSGELFLKLRDDPETVQTLTMPVLPLSLSEKPALVQPATTQPAAAMASPAQPRSAAVERRHRLRLPQAERFIRLKNRT